MCRAAAVALVAAGLGLSACGAGSLPTHANTIEAAPASTPTGSGIGPYPASARRPFMHNCEDVGAAGTVCGCILRRLEATVPLRVFIAGGRAIAAGAANLPSWLTAAVNVCTRDIPLKRRLNGARS